MKFVKLKNGTEYPESLVVVAMMNLNELYNSKLDGIPVGVFALLNFHEACRTNRPIRDQKLIDLALVNSDGTFSQTIRDIVLSAVEIDEASFNISLKSPVATVIENRSSTSIAPRSTTFSSSPVQITGTQNDVDSGNDNTKRNSIN